MGDWRNQVWTLAHQGGLLHFYKAPAAGRQREAGPELNEGTDALQLIQNTTPSIQHWPSLWKETTCIIFSEKIWQYKLLKRFNTRGSKRQDFFYVNHQLVQTTISLQHSTVQFLFSHRRYTIQYLYKWGKAVAHLSAWRRLGKTFTLQWIKIAI